MAHPKHRTSKQRRNKRRTHDAITVTAIAKCSGAESILCSQVNLSNTCLLLRSVTYC